MKHHKAAQIAVMLLFACANLSGTVRPVSADSAAENTALKVMPPRPEIRRKYPAPEPDNLSYFITSDDPEPVSITKNVSPGPQDDEGPAIFAPFTEDEIIMLAKTLYNETQVIFWNGTKWGMSYRARQAAVAWIALNRYDTGGFGDTLADILTAPGQFAYTDNAPVTEDMLALAADVIDRWMAEKQGDADAGRVIPADYLFFDGDGRENTFRKTFDRGGETWDWTLPDPYME